MENRRNEYRHTFGPFDRIKAEVLAPRFPEPQEGQVVNLSLHGMALVLKGENRIRRGEEITVHFELPQGEIRFTFQAVVIHAGVTGAETRYGLRFQPHPDRVAESARERLLWLFLMDEQRQLRRKLLLTRDLAKDWGVRPRPLVEKEE